MILRGNLLGLIEGKTTTTRDFKFLLISFRQLLQLHKTLLFSSQLGHFFSLSPSLSLYLSHASPRHPLSLVSTNSQKPIQK